jgi:hypothetical protein
MGYIASNDIHAYPVANRGGDYPFSRISTEYNTTQMTRNIVDKPGYVITSINSETSTTSLNTLEFVVDGYFFRTTFKYAYDASGLSGAGTVYAYIKLSNTDQTQELSPLEEVSAGDDSGTFYDIGFTGSTSSIPEGCISLPLFDVNANDDITIKEEYRYKIDRNSIDMQWIPL